MRFKRSLRLNKIFKQTYYELVMIASQHIQLNISNISTKKLLSQGLRLTFTETVVTFDTAAFPPLINSTHHFWSPPVLKITTVM